MTFAEVLRETIEEWPQVPDETYWTLVALPFVTLALCCVWLRVVWPCPDAAPKDFTPATLAKYSHHVTSESTFLHPWQGASSRVYSSIENGHGSSNGHGLSNKEPCTIVEENGIISNGKNGVTNGNLIGSDTPTRTDSLSGSNPGGRLLEAGEVAGDYSQDWKSTFDMTLLVVTVVWLMVNLGLTAWIKPSLFNRGEFWLLQIPKLACMIVVSVMAGLLCRHFCPTDSMGYIMTSKNSWFKVNYTRKIQHFAAYLVPLLFTPSAGCHCSGTLELSWGVWVTLIGFLVMIKPIREAIPMFMLQFNGLDRPEDRPNTLEWIIKYNIWPGELMIVLFAHLFAPAGQRNLVYILVFVTGVGDGLAEPVGIWLGKHKYMARSCDAGTYYQRSFEGSCCVFIITVVTVSMVYTSFATFWQFLVALLTLPLALTLAEAFSPHTMDTPFIMGLGGAMLYAIITLL